MASGEVKNRRKKLIQLVHVGKAKMGLGDDDYKAFLEGITGKQSCADLTERQLAAVLRAMRKNGFDYAPRRVKPEEKGGASVAQLEYIKGRMSQRCGRSAPGTKAMRRFWPL
jgi:phage gp16-like protein